MVLYLLRQYTTQLKLNKTYLAVWVLQIAGKNFIKFPPSFIQQFTHLIAENKTYGRKNQSSRNAKMFRFNVMGQVRPQQ